MKKPTKTKSFKSSSLEFTFECFLKANNVTGYTREHKFCTNRRWRFDFAWVDKKIAVEIEGGVWSGGRHTRGMGFIADCEKYNEALFLGWRVFRLTNESMTKVFFIKLLELLKTV